MALPLKKQLMCVVVMLMAFVYGVLGSETEGRLHTELFRKYNKYVRPVQRHNDSVVLQFGLSITQLLDVNEKAQSISTHVWLNQIWSDYRLSWDPVAYDDIEYIIIPAVWLWYPDMVLDNSVYGSSDLPVSKFATVEFDGTVWITPPAALNSQCHINIEYFPFDEQMCQLSFGPWEYTNEQVYLEPMHDIVVKEKFLENVEWELKGSKVHSINEELECCPGEQYSVVIYTITLRRRPLYYCINILVPCVLFAIITVLVYCLPPDSGEKITLSMSVLLALTLLSLLVADLMPATSETTPLIGRYLLFNIGMVSLSLVLSVVVLHIKYHPNKLSPVPIGMRETLLYSLPRKLCMKEWEGPYCKLRKTRPRLNITRNDGYRCVRGRSCRGHHAVIATVARKCPRKQGSVGTAKDNGPQYMPAGDVTMETTLSQSSTVDNIELEETIEGQGDNEEQQGERRYWSEFEKSIINDVSFISNRMKDRDKENEVKEEWRYVASVFDRLFLIIFAIGGLAGSCAIILSAPGLYTL
ncbi:neuronal acetylcholine receptor subunit alpha-6-like [Glandiceps talaboti]